MSVLRFINPLPFEHIRTLRAKKGREAMLEKSMIFGREEIQVKGFDLLISRWEFLDSGIPTGSCVIPGMEKSGSLLAKKVKRGRT